MAKRARQPAGLSRHRYRWRARPSRGEVQKLERQRDAVAAELRQVIETAQGMLDKLGDYAIVARRRARRAVRKVTRRRRRRLSAKGRANIIAAAKKRWARVRKGKAKGAK